MIKHEKNLLGLYLISLAFTLFIGFIDEGNYSFNFLLNINDLLGTFIFSGLFFLIPMLCYFASRRFWVGALGYVMVIGGLGWLFWGLG